MPIRWIVLGALLASSAPGVAAQAPERNTVGVSVVALSADSPVDAGIGLALRYTRDLSWGVPRDAAPPRPAGPWRLVGSLALHDVDRDPEPPFPAGEVQLLRASAALQRRLDVDWGEWQLFAGAGIDLFSGDGDETLVSAPELGIFTTYEVDTSVGFHARAEVARALAPGWEVFAGLGWLVADLDGEQRFVIDGVESQGNDVEFDMSGPQLDLGIGYRF